MIQALDVKSIGFTGTQKGMSKDQSIEVVRLVTEVLTNATEVHHGDCIGADEQFDMIARISAKDRGITVHCHPPISPIKRAFVEDRVVGPTVIYPVENYLDRNRTIVRSCDILIAAPFEDTEQRRSGTWSTVRYAIKAHKPTLLVFPNGELHLIALD